MKTFRLRCKKLCAVVLMIVTAFGFSFATPKTAQAANTKYWIKVNKQANVATVYQLKNGTYKPIKSISGILWRANTPAGTFYTPAKYRWQTLMGPSYGQYCTRVHGESYSIPCGIMKRILQHSLRFSLINLDRLHLMDVSVPALQTRNGYMRTAMVPSSAYSMVNTVPMNATRDLWEEDLLHH